ncbi:MAG: hypothetical protein QM586_10410 [Xenophilus sp.]
MPPAEAVVRLPAERQKKRDSLMPSSAARSPALMGSLGPQIAPSILVQQGFTGESAAASAANRRF